jgi:Tol biopolymer transport system component/DNA-binding winged helix-turn-helix (wHTH) protein
MVFRFENFELDGSERRLSQRIDGELASVRLENLPMDLLFLLVERHPQLVRHGEIADVLWPGLTAEAADDRIRTAIRKVRAALGEDTANPRYIEGVARRGYRFIAPVSVVPVANEPPNAEDRTPELGELSYSPTSRWRAILAAILVAVALLIVATGGVRVAKNIAGSGDSSTRPLLRWKALTGNIITYGKLASDGQRVYWTQYDPGCRPYSIPVGGGVPQAVPIPFAEATLLDATLFNAPLFDATAHPGNHSSLLVNRRAACVGVDPEGELWEIDLGSSPPAAHHVGNLRAMDAAYSRDGSQIAYSVNYDLWIARRDGTSPRKVATLPSSVWGIRWSPDGRGLRFAVFVGNDGRYRLWEATLDGKRVRPLLPGRANSWEGVGGAWDDRGDFWFVGNYVGQGDLWKVHGGSGLFGGGVFGYGGANHAERVTEGPLEYDIPTEIPGSRDLLVLGTQRKAALARYDSASHSFVPYLNGISAQMADFSRDGRYVAYVSYPDRLLWRCRRDGSEAIQLTRAPLQAGMPRFSPDGSQIAFTGQAPGSDLKLYVISAAGGVVKRMTSDDAPTVREVVATWSPDGTRMLYRHDAGAGVGMEQTDLRILDVAGNRATVIPGSFRMYNQRWSPDGKWIVATSSDAHTLSLFDVARSEWKILAKLGAEYPSWSADSKVVYVLNTDGKWPAIYRISIDTGKPELAASLENVNQAVDLLWGMWFGLTPEGDPLIVRNADMRQIYALTP